MGWLIRNIGTLIVSAGETPDVRRRTWIQGDGPRIVALGDGPHDEPKVEGEVFDAHGGMVLPGFVDMHTHPIFAGSRAEEFVAKAGGMTYQEIAARGGGIQVNVAATRRASDAELLTGAQENIRRMTRWGTTSLEAKTGYGLGVEEELRLCRILARLAASSPQTISITCLALHDRSPDFASLDEYVDAVIARVVPSLGGIPGVEAVDAFVEQGYFDVDQARRFFAAARSLGLRAVVHADEFSDAGGACLAAEVSARSADHLQFASEAGLRAMAEAGVVGVLLPGTSLYSRIPYVDGGKLRRAGCAMAVATDFNPGSSRIVSLPLAASLSVRYSGLTVMEALAGVTRVPARALGLAQGQGTVALGGVADLVCYQSMQSVEDWIADFGQTLPSQVWLRGEMQSPRD